MATNIEICIAKPCANNVNNHIAYCRTKDTVASNGLITLFQLPKILHTYVCTNAHETDHWYSITNVIYKLIIKLTCRMMGLDNALWLTAYNGLLKGQAHD